VAAGYVRQGFGLFATAGTRAFLEGCGVPCEPVFKVGEGKPDAVDLLRDGQIQMVINTPLGRKSQFDEAAIRVEAIALQVPCLTTVEAARAALLGIRALSDRRPDYRPLRKWQ
jgi:carbamoyl-phosphate synthase large subunit